MNLCLYHVRAESERNLSGICQEKGTPPVASLTPPVAFSAMH